MILPPIEQISKKDIDALVENQVAEGKDIEYKLRLLGKSDGDKKKFLASVSSFANSNGGFLIYGIKCGEDEDGKTNGIAEEANGLADVNPDFEISRLNGIIDFGLSPKIPGLHIAPFSGFPQGPIIIIQVPQSWSRPHQVAFQDWSRFYTRNSNGKSLMDISEIRGAFLQSQSVYQRIEDFRKKRIQLVLDQQSPVTEYEIKPTVVLHLIPLGFEDPTMRVDISKNLRVLEQLKPFCKDLYSGRLNFDGYLTSRRDEREVTLSYTQFFRSGIIESANSFLIKIRDDKKIIGNITFEETVIGALENQLEVINLLGLKGPFVFLVSLLGVKGFSLPSSIYDDHGSTPIEKEDLLFPDILMEDANARADHILRPFFDMVYQSCGREKCPNYDQDGNWKEARR